MSQWSRGLLHTPLDHHRFDQWSNRCMYLPLREEGVTGRGRFTEPPLQQRDRLRT